MRVRSWSRRRAAAYFNRADAAVAGDFTDNATGAVPKVTSAGVLTQQNADPGRVLNGSVSTNSNSYNVYRCRRRRRIASKPIRRSMVCSSADLQR